jgi:hypothetical protein
MACYFCESNPEYKYYFNLFDFQWENTFSTGQITETDPDYTSIGRACSEAMAWFAVGEVRVFNHWDGECGVSILVLVVSLEGMADQCGL